MPNLTISPLVLLAAILKVTISQTLQETTPQWFYGSTPGTPASTQVVGATHISQFFMVDSGSYYFTGMQVYYGSPATASTMAAPGCTTTSTGVLFPATPLSSTQIITKVTFGYETSSLGNPRFVSIRIDLNDGTTFHTLTMPGSSGSATHSYTAAAGEEIVGFQLEDANSCGRMYHIGVYTVPAADCTASTSISLSVVNIQGQTMILFTGAAQTLSFTATDNTSGACGSMEYSLDYTPASSTPSLISLDTTTPTNVKFKASSTTGDAQGYQVAIFARFVGKTTLWPTSASATYTYVNPCSSATITGPTFPAITTSMFVSASSTTTSIWYDSVSGSAGPPLCGTFTIYKYFSTAPTAFVPATMGSEFTTSIASTFATFTVNPTFQPQEVGSYVLNFDVCLTNYNMRCISFTTNVQINACVVTSVQVVDSPSLAALADKSFFLNGVAASWLLTTKQTPNCGYASSGWAVTQTGITGTRTGDFDTINAATGSYNLVAMTQPNRAGTYSIAITSVTVNGVVYTAAQLVTPNTFILTVSTGCSATVITPSTVAPISLKVWDSLASYPSAGVAYTEFTDSVSAASGNAMLCPKTYTATISPTTVTTFNLDTTNKNFQIYSGAYSQIGSYTVTLVGALVEVPSVTVSTTFTITVGDPCPTTTLIQPAVLSPMTTSVLVASGAITQQVGAIKDQVSVDHGDVTGTQYCSARQYTLTSTTTASGLTPTELSIDSNGLISVYTARNAAIGTHTVTVTVTLSSYSSITITLPSFTVEIIGCIITAFTMVNLSPTNDQTYTISDPALAWSLAGSSTTTQVPACGYAQIVSSGAMPTFVSSVSGPSINYSAQTRDLTFAGSNSISVTSTLIGYNFNPARVAPSCSSSFQLTTIDPCLTTAITIVPTSVENFVAFAGYNITSLVKYTFNDSQSFTRTLTSDPSDFCGQKLLSFTINSTATTLFNAINQDFIYFSPPSNTTSFGVGQAQIVSTMQNYPTIASSPISFTATILGSVIPVITDQFYLTGSAPLRITYQAFKVLPTGYDAGPNTVQAYIFTGTSWPTYIDVTSKDLTQISGLTWIQFDASTDTFVISTTSSQFVGVYQIALVQSFANFVGVNPFTHFTITIKPVPVAPVLNKPPFFQTPLLPQTVAQCPGSKAELWSYQLPPYQDPNNSPVTVSVQFKSDFFTFDNTAMTITQKKVVESSVNETIKIVLQDELNMQSSYSMVVQFVCNSTPNITFNFTLREQQNYVAKQKQWPQAYIAMVEPSGLMHVKFNQKMKIPEHPEYIQNETITLDDKTFPILKLNVIPGNYSDPQMLTFNWTFVSFKTTEMLIQLDFKHMQYVSQNTKYPDQIQLTIFGFQLFADTYGNFMRPPTELKPKILPVMFSLSEAASAQAIADTAKGAMQSAMLVNTVVSLVISGPLQQLLSSVKQLQIIVHITLINVAYPATATIFLGMLMNVLTFQFYNFSNFYNMVFNLDPDSFGSQPLNNQFNMLGYNALYIIQNFGTLCWTIFIAPIGWAVAPMIVHLLKGEFAHLKTKFNRMMFYNYWIGFINESYLFLTVCAALNLFNFKWNTYGDAINSFLALFSGSILIAFPIFVGVFYNLRSNYEKITSKNEEFLARYGNAITGLNFKRRGKLVFIHTCASILRKLSLAYMVVFQQSKPIFSIFLVNFQAILMMSTSGFTEPMSDKVANTMDLVNESFVLLNTYHLYQFTEFMTNLDNRSYTGKSLMLLIIFNVLLNIGVVVLQTASLAIRKLKLRHMKWKELRRIKQQLKRQLYIAQMRALKNKIRLKDAQIARRAEREQLAQLEKTKLNLEHLEKTQLQLPNPEATQKVIKPSNFQSQLVVKKLPSKPHIAPLKSILKKSAGVSNQINNDQSPQLRSQSKLKNYSMRNDAFGGEPGSAQKLVEAKVKSNDIDRLSQSNKKINFVGPAPQVPSNAETFEEVILRYPNIKTTTLGTLFSAMNKSKIELKEVLHAGRIIRFTILVDGKSQHSYFVSKRDTDQSVIQICEEAKDHAKSLVVDFENWIQEDIESGKFEIKLQQYQKLRQRYVKDGKAIKNATFQDFGEYDPEADLKSKIELYRTFMTKPQLP